VPGFQRWLDTAAGPVAVIDGRLTFSDTLGSWKARWGIGRLSYIVPPGLYAIGAPDADAPVIVSANYKMSYDLVRQALSSRNVWLLILETYGINVWCAAGKGTFGTGELVRRIESSRVSDVVNHRRLILPVMGAAGVKALEVRKRTGFEVLFGTLRVEDLPEYLDSGLKSAAAMRELTFTAHERLVLTPIEIVSGMKSLLPVGLPLAVLAGFTGAGFSPQRALTALALYALAVLCGTFVSPLLLPYLPGRMFAIKGAVAGGAGAFVSISVLSSLHRSLDSLEAGAIALLMSAVSAFYAMNFTGSTPFTSPSGVRKEMKYALPLMLSASVLGVILMVIVGLVP